jgi:DNA-binding transcriptional regulator LsrR (DeoR family)
MGYFGQLTVALVGIGSMHPSRLLGESGNVFAKEELAELERIGAVGDICMRFFDRKGRDIASPFNDRVIGMSLQQLRLVPRPIGIAGTARKLEAVRGALEGRLITALVTDRFTAERLVAEPMSTGNPNQEILDVDLPAGRTGSPSARQPSHTRSRSN